MLDAVTERRGVVFGQAEARLGPHRPEEDGRPGHRANVTLAVDATIRTLHNHDGEQRATGREQKTHREPQLLPRPDRTVPKSGRVDDLHVREREPEHA